MAQARRWLWGLVPLAVLWVAALSLKTSPMEADIAARVAPKLAPYGLNKASLVVNGRDVTLAGPVYEAEAGRAAADRPWRQDADHVRGVRLVRDKTALSARARPYVLSADKVGGKTVLSGNVPRPEARAAVLAAARIQGGEVQDGLGYASGAPAGLAVAGVYALGQLAGLTEGKASITDDTISITGRARDKASRDAVIDALRKLPAGFKLAHVDISVPSYDFVAAKDPVAGTLTLSGLVPDAATRQSLLEAARRLFFRERVVDETKIEAGGAPAGFGQAALLALRQLARLDGGKFTLRDNEVSLTGAPFFAQAGDEIRAALAGLGSLFTSRFEVLARPASVPVAAAACQTLFSELLARGTILFETGSDRIDRSSEGVLDNLVGVTQRCPAQNFEIGGHTDSTGSDEINIDLSRRRAQAVADYLARAGLGPDRLKAVGYGSGRPVGPNETEEGRARNRRIEILVN